MHKIFPSVLLIISFSVNSFAQSLPPSILVDKGNEYAQSYNVGLQLTCENAIKMMVSNHKNFNDAHWAHFEPKINWELVPKDGKQTVYAKFLDKDNNEIGPVSDDVLVDATPPTDISISIDVPRKISNEKLHIVDLKIKAIGTKYMMISNNGAFYGHKWQFYETEVFDWELEQGGDGEYTVYARFRDVAGNISETVKDKIVFDTQRPFNCSVVINKNDKYTFRQDGKVDITIFANEADSMMISADKAFKNATWATYNTRTSFSFEEGDGTKEVFMKFKDFAGNETGIFADDIILDTTPPQDCGFFIDAGAGITKDINKKVVLSFDAKEATHILVSNYPDFRAARWQLFKPVIKGWQLSGEKDGLKIVYARFKDEAGNVSTIYKDDIQLKRGF